MRLTKSELLSGKDSLSLTVSHLIGRVGLRVVGAFETLSRRRAQRRAVAQLKGLDDRMLADIGISRSEIASVVAGDVNERRRLTETRFPGPV